MEVEVIKKIEEIPGNGDELKKKKKLRVAAYARVSTDMEDQKTSYYSQIEHYSNYIKKNKDWNAYYGKTHKN